MALPSGPGPVPGHSNTSIHHYVPYFTQMASLLMRIAKFLPSSILPTNLPYASCLDEFKPRLRLSLNCSYPSPVIHAMVMVSNEMDCGRNLLADYHYERGAFCGRSGKYASASPTVIYSYLASTMDRNIYFLFTIYKLSSSHPISSHPIKLSYHHVFKHIQIHI